MNTKYFSMMHSTHFLYNTEKDNSDSEKGNPISSKGSFKCTIPQTG